MAEAKEKVIESIQKAGVAAHLKKAKDAAMVAAGVAATKAVAASKLAVKRANEEPNRPQIGAMGIATAAGTGIGGVGHKVLERLTAKLVKPDETDPSVYVSTGWRKAVVHGTLPLVGAVTMGATFKYASKRGLAAAGGIGVGLGLILGSVGRTLMVPLEATAPDQIELV